MMYRIRIVALLVLSTTIGAAQAGEEFRSWRPVDMAVVEALDTRDLGTWAREIAETPPPENAQALLQALSVVLRAGHERVATRVAHRFADLEHSHLDFELGRAVSFMTLRGQIAPAIALIEARPGVRPDHLSVLLGEWRRTATDEEIDRWLVARAAAAAGAKVPRSRRSGSGLEFWLKRRIDFRKEIGTAGQLIDSLAAAVRKHPGDLKPAITYIHAVGRVERKRPLDLGWVAENADPENAWECYRIARAMDSEDPETAAALLTRSLALPITRADTDAVFDAMKGAQMDVMSGEMAAKLLRRWTRLELTGVLERLDRAEELAAVIGDLSEEDGGVPDRRLARMAGEAARETGDKDIERRIRAEESSQGKSAKYWLRRAEFFAGREDGKETERSLRRALGTAPLERPRGKGNFVSRGRVVERLSEFLAAERGPSAAMEFLFAELEAHPPGGDHARCVIDEFLDLERDTKAFPDPFDPRLWRYLESRPVWDSEEASLLRVIWAHAEEDRRKEVIDRASKMVANADPSRSLRLGEQIAGFPVPHRSRATAYLEDARRRHSNAADRLRATRCLFRLYSRPETWSRAEALYPEIRVGMYPEHRVQALADLASCAARAGEKAHAIRLLARRANLDRVAGIGLSSLLNGDLPVATRAFYAGLAAGDPEFVMPRKLREMLEER